MDHDPAEANVWPAPRARSLKKGKLFNTPKDTFGHPPECVRRKMQKQLRKLCCRAAPPVPPVEKQGKAWTPNQMWEILPSSTLCCFLFAPTAGSLVACCFLLVICWHLLGGFFCLFFRPLWSFAFMFSLLKNGAKWGEAQGAAANT